MRTIHKKVIRIADYQTVDMSPCGKPLAVQVQDDQPCLWFETDTEVASEPRTILIRGTGHKFTGKESRYIGTFQIQDGALVFHAYEAWR